MNSLTILALFCSSVVLAQKPTVSIVVWDGKAKEGHDHGEIRIYQLGKPTASLNVKIKYQGTAREGIDYRAFETDL